ncbi:Protein CBG00719 [Caenorhabditis briggsae]|uniref:Protein CBG00719 n=1 Tax=Caenorhabditis briggsae TaxID=6238 RepID=A8WN82_CAEBR|nr:Protein CBG00719 [Caenorhabditis briggsae]CAP21936.2 Protein CBG00719 [Caenorhabditis briggsae]
MTRQKSLKTMIISNSINFLGLLLVLGVTFGVYNSISNPTDENFQKEFLSVLESKSEKGMKTLHKYQQATKCCGVPLSSDISWNQTSISLGNPWASWYYYTMLDEDYIDETRRLFTLPWSCCSDRTLECEHLAFERFPFSKVFPLFNPPILHHFRVSIEPSSKNVIIDELVVVEHRLRKARRSEDARQSVYENSCEPPTKILLAGVPMQLLGVGAGFALLTLSAIGLDGFFIWKFYKSQQENYNFPLIRK